MPFAKRHPGHSHVLLRPNSYIVGDPSVLRLDETPLPGESRANLHAPPIRFFLRSELLGSLSSRLFRSRRRAFFVALHGTVFGTLESLLFFLGVEMITKPNSRELSVSFP